ncbi:MAG: 50S ribosomal protein L25/general stress protein Ctc [Alphaproteobacteria bacterium]|jgi:large subunit ribosomal protein L25|nr:50S ribosomal protein L25/general stress protein Ctc [Alphaproteobacteria bacterium]MDG1467440.1 50S ribosomal protein L25/general stress protein Ctc [Alphaproteobacteria bacterium]MDG1882351.1 50S ribosomal protein L25/general stress protein Ctc [Alphaproteobacteria bacterium]MDG2458233.1 50S ribosomal protein L25/general stress protein Ctc [Alphaproteobacteria bacterium]|tara:strand:- start:992 stop:1636 length:645 start_codon:yes stop_codon:yes gene_type:complete
METIDIKAEARSQVGKGSARAARRAGLVPAVIYGNKETAVSVTLDANQWRQLMHKPGIFSQLININVNNETHFVLPRDIQQHPVSEEAMHVDFLRVTKNATVAVGIAVEFLNEDKCTGLKLGGVLNIVRSQVELNCPAISIPEKLTVDLEGLNVGHTIHISSIELPEGCTPTITDRDFTVATIAAPRGGLDDDADETENTEEVSEETEESKSDS